MDITGRRRSEQFEDRGRGQGRSGGGGVPLHLLSTVVRFLGVKGTVIAAGVVGLGYLVLPSGLRETLVSQLLGGAPISATTPPTAGAGACQKSPAQSSACDFSRAVLASTEDVWTAKFQSGELPSYGTLPNIYALPTLVVFSESVDTAGCGSASASSGPFYCPADRKLYIDPTFYEVMEQRLKAPGDFAQAYVIAHEVGHHVQNLIGSSRLTVQGETKNQVSVRVELQADCLAGVWGHTARGQLSITDADLKEALTAAHAIGDDTLGHNNTTTFTHGSAAQRAHWFKLGFDSGDATKCDTFAVEDHSRL